MSPITIDWRSDGGAQSGSPVFRYLEVQFRDAKSFAKVRFYIENDLWIFSDNSNLVEKSTPIPLKLTFCRWKILAHWNGAHGIHFRYSEKRRLIFCSFFSETKTSKMRHTDVCLCRSVGWPRHPEKKLTWVGKKLQTFIGISLYKRCKAYLIYFFWNKKSIGQPSSTILKLVSLSDSIPIFHRFIFLWVFFSFSANTIRIILTSSGGGSISTTFILPRVSLSVVDFLEKQSLPVFVAHFRPPGAIYPSVVVYQSWKYDFCAC